MAGPERRLWDYADWVEATHPEILRAVEEQEHGTRVLKELLKEAGVGSEPYSALSEQIAQDWAALVE